jgi:hypothetical protein
MGIVIILIFRLRVRFLGIILLWILRRLVVRVRQVVIMRLVSVRRVLGWDRLEGEMVAEMGIGEVWKEGRAKRKDVDARPGITE